jgi:REP element-mobilizing transposase RayT
MARPLRIQVVDGWYHVTARGIERREIFADTACYTHFLELLTEWVPRFRVRLHAYVLMPNHVHLVVSTPEANLSTAMQWLKTSYSMWFNRRTQRVGPLFQGRYKAELLEGRAVAWAVTQYVHLNPVRVQRLGLGKAAKRREGQGRIAPPPEQVRERLAVLRDYRWSSYPWYAGRRDAPPGLSVREVLTGGRAAGLAEQQKAYRRAVEAAVGADENAAVLPPAIGGLLRGSAPWVAAMCRRLQGDVGEQGALQRLAVRPGWVEIRRAVEQVKGEPWEQFAERHGDPGRDVALYVLRQAGGLRLWTAGQQVGLTHYRAAAQALHRMKRRLKTDQRLQRLLAEVVKCIKIKT